MLITGISFILASILWKTGSPYLGAFTIFLGQLVIGWSNDIYDYEDDLKHNRQNKPLVSGEIKKEKLVAVTLAAIPIAITANLAGPLGLRGGSIYLLGVGCGIAYNFYFKFTVLSPLPYFIACAALPASIFIASDRTPPLWVLATGSLLGTAFHFANVLKDLKEDRESNIGGLPQRTNRKITILVIMVLLIGVTLILINSPVTKTISKNSQNY